MAATPPSDLFAESACFACYGVGTSDMLKLALLARISQAVGPVDSFVDRAGISDATQIAALTTLFNSAVAHGWWDKCDLIYPFVGGTAQAHAQNFKSANFTITWNGTVTHNANGITGDGATGYGNTGYTPSSSGQIALNSAHLGLYRRTAGSNQTYAGSTTAAESLSVAKFLAGTTLIVRENDFTNSQLTPTVLAWLTASRIDGTNKHLYSGASDLSAAVAPIAVPGVVLFVLANNNNGVAAAFNSSNLAGLTAGAGLTFAEFALMRDDWQTFQTSLGRNV